MIDDSVVDEIAHRHRLNPPQPPPKFLIVHFKFTEGETYLFAREDNEMIIGAVEWWQEKHFDLELLLQCSGISRPDRREVRHCRIYAGRDDLVDLNPNDS